ncbi:MAG: PilZ domain-containing protein [candidate division FCPU426 bacterium]
MEEQPDLKGEMVVVESRRYPRIPLRMKLKYRILIRGEKSRFEVSHSLADDLGAKGLAMSSQSPLQGGQLLTLTLFLPPESKRRELVDASVFKEDECNLVSILARVAWSKPRGEGRYAVGVEFLDLEPSSRKLLKQFLVDFELDDMNSPLYT